MIALMSLVVYYKLENNKLQYVTDNYAGKLNLSSYEIVYYGNNLLEEIDNCFNNGEHLVNYSEKRTLVDIYTHIEWVLENYKTFSETYQVLLTAYSLEESYHQIPTIYQSELNDLSNTVRNCLSDQSDYTRLTHALNKIKQIAEIFVYSFETFPHAEDNGGVITVQESMQFADDVVKSIVFAQEYYQENIEPLF